MANQKMSSDLILGFTKTRKVRVIERETDRIDVAPVSLLLWMLKRISVDLACAC